MADWGFPDFDGHEGVHLFSDPASGLQAVIAVHSTHLGPAAGGARFWHYATPDRAITDALRLSRGMSYKNAIAGLPCGGGKAVILGDGSARATPAQLRAFGHAVQRLGGRYVTAEDVGIGVGDLEQVAQATRFVAGLPGNGGDPSPHTAAGVFHGLRAAVKTALGRADLNGLRVAVQGLGSVGRHLCERLHAAGARLWVADLDPARVRTVCERHAAQAVATDQILFQPADVLAPCALGAVLNAHSIPRLRAAVIAGAANNLLFDDEDGERLRQRGILYAPDYVINAGGIMAVSAGYRGEMADASLQARIAGIGDTLATIFAEATRRGLPTSRIADEMAHARLAAASGGAFGAAA